MGLTAFGTAGTSLTLGTLAEREQARVDEAGRAVRASAAVSFGVAARAVVLVTGFGVELTSDQRRAHGVDAVLVKPLQIQDVLDAVAKMARPRA